MVNQILFFNPKAAETKPRIPNSILAVAASIDGKYEFVIVDGNVESDPLRKIVSYLSSGKFGYFACTCMPGPQLKQAIPFTKLVKEKFPKTKVIWGGYFASNQYKSVLSSGWVDAVVNGPGDKAFPALIDAWERNDSIQNIKNIIFLQGNTITKTPKDELFDLDALNPLPYQKLNDFYPIRGYLGKTYLGTRTIAYHSSFGCPFTCSFCAVVPIYNARWKGKSALGIYNDIKYLKESYGGNAIEFHDNNFFVSEKRTVEFSELIRPEKMIWWGEGRIDTLNKYSDHSLSAIRESGCKMIFFGAETGNDAVLKRMDKGGTQSGKLIKDFAARMKKFDIIPEYSFVLGLPGENESQVMAQIDEDISFIKQIKEINPNTEIIIYLYSPVPTEGSEMYAQVLKSGFSFPSNLEDWLSPAWEKFDLRKNPLTPWLNAEMIDKIKNFETVLNGYYPTISDVRLSQTQRQIMRSISRIRYTTGFHAFPLEIKALQKIWNYRQPEIQGF